MSKMRKRDVHEELHKIDKDRRQLHQKCKIKQTKKLWLLHMIQKPYIYYKAYTIRKVSKSKNNIQQDQTSLEMLKECPKSYMAYTSEMNLRKGN